MAAVNTGCKDDDDEGTPDPRIRRVVFSQLGTDVEFLVNDTEGKIYNYDSLAYGTRVDSLHPVFYQYLSSANKNDLSFKYSYDGGVNYIDFRNTVAINFTKPVKIISTNTENNSAKEYTLEIRVHKYDIDAFEWTNIGEFSELGETVLSQKSLLHNDMLLQFIQTIDACKVISSSDGHKWSSSNIDAPETLELSTLCSIDNTLFVQGKSGAYYTADFTDLKFEKFDAISGGQLLYSLNKQIWVTDGGNITSYDKNGELKLSQPLPEKFVVDTISPFVAPTGYYTLGYLYAKKGDNAEIWAADRYGNIECLTDASKGLPYMDKAIVFNFNNTLSIIGGIKTNGSFSSECYTSENSGLTWSLDKHKDLSNVVGGVADAGIFKTGDKGEFILIGGQTPNGSSNKVWALRLKKLLLEESFLNKIK